jgi:hypothetical protein
MERSKEGHHTEDWQTESKMILAGFPSNLFKNSPSVR